MKVFLGGTCNGSDWREKVIEKLDIDYFNPITAHWDKAAQLNEFKEKENADFLLFVLTPLMEGAYSIAEVVDASNKKPEKTILCILDTDGDRKWTKHQKDSLRAIENLVQSNGGYISSSIEETIAILNSNQY